MTTSPVTSITDEQLAEIESLANEAGSIEWYASTAYCSTADKESLAIYHRPNPFHCVEIVETPDSDPRNGECIHSKEYWSFIGAAHPAAIIALITRLREAEADAEKWREHQSSALIKNKPELDDYVEWFCPECLVKQYTIGENHLKSHKPGCSLADAVEPHK